jgi:succinate dehydrogenase/fumarate reductase flavoprotein subunit
MKRSVRVEMNDGAVVFRNWDQAPEVIEEMYCSEARHLTECYLHDRPVEDLTCSLIDALETTQLLDEAERFIG